MTSITEVKEYIEKSEDMEAILDIRLWAYARRTELLKKALKP